MRQVLHLLIIDTDRSAVLSADYGSNWLLPVLTCAERVRAAPAVLRWTTSRGLACDVAGQWLGRVTPEATDWLIVLCAERTDPPPDPLTWIRLDTLASTTALVEYQGWALRRSLERGTQPSMPGPFGRVGWTDEVKAWIGAAVGALPCGRLTQYRSSPHEVVLGAHTRLGPVYFKGLTPERRSEAALTRTLATLAPVRFAPTVALEERPDGSIWWLMAGCPGEPAAEGQQVACALASMQRRVMTSECALCELSVLSLGAALRWATEMVRDADCAGLIAHHFGQMMSAGLPESWIPMDLDRTNVLADENGEVRFIDLDDSYLGPAPLAIALFAKRCRNTSLYEAYEQSWSPRMFRIDWPSFEVAALVVDAWLGWQRLERNTRRGEVHGALELGAKRLRERLARAVHRR